MAKQSVIQKNLRKSRVVQNHAQKRAELKAIIYNKLLPLDERFKAQLQLSQMPRDGSKVRLRNRCEITGRGRGYCGQFRLSRICFRELASRGELPGVIKSSW